MLDVFSLCIPHEVKCFHVLGIVFANEVRCIQLKIIDLWQETSLDFGKLTAIYGADCLQINGGRLTVLLQTQPLVIPIQQLAFI